MGSKDTYFYGTSGSFERLPCGDFRSFSYGHHESNTGSSTYTEIGTGDAFASGSNGARTRGDGVQYWSHTEFLPWDPWGAFAPESFTFTESGIRSSHYTEDGNAETSNTFTTSASADYSESSLETNNRSEIVTASASPPPISTSTDTRTSTTSGNENYSRSMSSSFTAKGSLTVTPWESGGFGSGCAYSTSSGSSPPPPDPYEPIGSRTGSFTQNYKKTETLSRSEHWSGNATHTESSGNGQIMAILDDHKTATSSRDLQGMGHLQRSCLWGWERVAGFVRWIRLQECFSHPAGNCNQPAHAGK